MLNGHDDCEAVSEKNEHGERKSDKTNKSTIFRLCNKDWAGLVPSGWDS